MAVAAADYCCPEQVSSQASCNQLSSRWCMVQGWCSVLFPELFRSSELCSEWWWNSVLSLGLFAAFARSEWWSRELPYQAEGLRFHLAESHCPDLWR